MSEQVAKYKWEIIPAVIRASIYALPINYSLSLHIRCFSAQGRLENEEEKKENASNNI